MNKPPLTFPTTTDPTTGGIFFRGHLPKNHGIWHGPDRTLASFGLVYVYAGGGRYRDAHGVEASIQAGSLILLYPGIAHAYGPPAGQTWSEFFLLFESPLCATLRETGFLSLEAPIHQLEPIDYWRPRFESLIDTPPVAPAKSGMQELGKLFSLLGDALEPAPSDHSLDWLHRAQAELAQPGRTPESAARALGLGYENFRKKFRRLSGQSPKQYQQRALLERACQLLATTDDKLEVIAEELGYCDAFHFSKQFKQAIGLSPRDYRHLHGR